MTDVLVTERLERLLRRFATEQEWTLSPPDQGTYELKSKAFGDARLFVKFDAAASGTLYASFMFAIGAIRDERQVYELLRMNAGGFVMSPFFFSIYEMEGHKMLRLEASLVLPKDATDDGIVGCLHGAFVTLLAGFAMAPWAELMKNADIFLFPEDMQ